MRRAVAAVAVITIVAIELWSAVPADARFGATGSGNARAQASVITAPPAPTITGVSLGGLGLTCLVSLSWPAPPAGRQYKITRTIGVSNLQIVAPTSSAGTVVDSILLTLLTGTPGYTMTATYTAAPQWTAVSTSSGASGCLGFL